MMEDKIVKLDFLQNDFWPKIKTSFNKKLYTFDGNEGHIVKIDIGEIPTNVEAVYATFSGIYMDGAVFEMDMLLSYDVLNRYSSCTICSVYDVDLIQYTSSSIYLYLYMGIKKISGYMCTSEYGINLINDITCSHDAPSLELKNYLLSYDEDIDIDDPLNNNEDGLLSGFIVNSYPRQVDVTVPDNIKDEANSLRIGQYDTVTDSISYDTYNPFASDSTNAILSIYSSHVTDTLNDNILITIDGALSGTGLINLDLSNSTLHAYFNTDSAQIMNDYLLRNNDNLPFRLSEAVGYDGDGFIKNEPLSGLASGLIIYGTLYPTLIMNRYMNSFKAFPVYAANKLTNPITICLEGDVTSDAYALNASEVLQPITTTISQSYTNSLINEINDNLLNQENFIEIKNVDTTDYLSGNNGYIITYHNHTELIVDIFYDFDVEGVNYYINLPQLNKNIASINIYFNSNITTKPTHVSRLFIKYVDTYVGENSNMLIINNNGATDIDGNSINSELNITFASGFCSTNNHIRLMPNLINIIEISRFITPFDLHPVYYVHGRLPN